jgi:hypothetical protein
VAICIDGNFLILKFVGNTNHQIYQLYYIKKEEEYSPGEWIAYFGATMNDLLKNGNDEILISLIHIVEQPGDDWGRFETRIYRPDTVTSITSSTDNIPESHELSQNYPNPFNSYTSINFQVPRTSQVIIKVFDLLGEEVAKVFEGEVSIGKHRITWDGKDQNSNPVNSGIYFIQFISDNIQKTIKTILLK